MAASAVLAPIDGASAGRVETDPLVVPELLVRASCGRPPARRRGSTPDPSTTPT